MARWKASGRNSVVECQLPKLDVAGSNPVARSTLLGIPGNIWPEHGEPRKRVVSKHRYLAR